MALVIKDRVKETTSTTGTGTLTLAGAAVGFDAFSSIGDGNTTYYAIVDSANAAWEVGIGTYTASGTTLSRDTVLESSNSDALVDFASGVKNVFCTMPAEKSVVLDGSGNLTIEGNLTVNGTTTTVNAENLAVADNMIYMNDGNAVANPDLGIAGNYNDGTYAHAGFFRDATDGRWKVFDSYTPEPDAATEINTSHASFSLADIQAANFIGDLTGNADTATALETSRTISLTGDVTGSSSFNGTANATISATVADDSHNHVISNVDGLQTALDAKQAAATALTTTTSFGGDVSGTYNSIVVADDSHNHVISNIDGLQTALDNINTDLVNDTTPQLAGDLDLNSNDITGTGNINITGNVSLTGTVDGRNVSSDGSKLDGIASGANNYTHPSYNGDDFSVDTGALTGATVVSDIDINVTTDTLGHVTDANGVVSTRTLTLANLGYTGATNANYITNNNQLTNGAGYITSSGSITGNAGSVDGYSVSTSRNAANTIPVRDSNGYANFGWINTTSGDTTSTLSRAFVETANDGYIRTCTMSHLSSQLGAWTTGGTSFSNASNGYIKFPNRFAIAWCEGPGTGSEIDRTTSFPVTFTNVRRVVVGTRDPGGGIDGMYQLRSFNTTSATARLNKFNSGGGTGYPICIVFGYI
jgi:hypothetical protein